MPFVVNELRRYCAEELRKYRNAEADNTLQPTVIVSEAYLKLRNAKHSHMNHRADFYALSAEIIKHIIIDYVRRKHAARRNYGVEAESLDDVGFNFSWIRNSKNTSIEDLLGFQEVLEKVRAQIHQRESGAWPKILCRIDRRGNCKNLWTSPCPLSGEI
jgi:DNA-directed RNA polymerase specialized sigma24 family protein